MRLRLLVPALLLAGGIGFGVALPRWQTVRIEIHPGGKTYSRDGGPSRPVPAMLTFPRNGRTSLQIVNQDSNFRALGAIAVPPRRFMVTPPEACTAHDSSDRTVSLLLW